MNGVDVIRAGLSDLHAELRRDLADLDPDLVFWQPRPEVNHIGFILWHLVRDEDSVVSHTAKLREVWEEGGWAKRLNLESSEATLPGPEAAALRYGLAGFLEYAEVVWEATRQRLLDMTDDNLDRQAWPDWTVARHLVEGCIGHSWLHLGEIRYIRGLRGWRYRE
jgi:hypothetical protein